MQSTKVVRIWYDVYPMYVDVRLPATTDPEFYDDWFDAVNSKVDVEHTYEELKTFPEDGETDWDLTEG